MDTRWTELLETLRQLLGYYRALLEINQNKQQVLIKVDSKALEKLTQQEEIIIVKMGKVEELRRKAVDDLADFYGVPKSQMDLSELRRHAEGAVMDELGAITAAFEAVWAELMPLNEANAKLIQQALGIIQYNLNLLSNNSVGHTYADGGNDAGPVRKSIMLDAKA